MGRISGQYAYERATTRRFRQDTGRCVANPKVNQPNQEPPDLESDRYTTAIRLFDEANSADPNLEIIDGLPQPKELIYGRRMSVCLDSFAPDAPEAVRLAARCQHIRRWEIPRDTYPRDRSGYLRWRTNLRKFHAEVAGEILKAAGYDDDLIGQAQSLLRKENLKTNPDTQTLEDVICLVFLQYYFDDFVGQHEHEPEKIVDIVRKTWVKMSDAGHDAALKLVLTDRSKALVLEALS